MRAAGAIIPNVENSFTVLDLDDEFADLFRYDRMQGTTLMRRSRLHPITDSDVVQVQRQLQRLGLARVTKGTVRDAIEQVAKKNSFHPVRDYLDKLSWDGTPRLTVFAHEYLRADDTPYNAAIGAMVLISMVARIYRPGCKNDHMMILEGGQGTFKSSTCEVLAGEWFSDHLPELNSKDVSIHLRGKWVIEIPEMHTFNRAESTALKAFISRTEERYRMPYAVTEETQPRQNIFIGTSNQDRYLRDETGGRRFWPIKCGMIEIDRVRNDRDQLFAEAVTEFHSGTKWWPEPKFEAEVIVPEQIARREVDAWLEPISLHVAPLVETTIMAVATGALAMKPDRLDMLAQRRIAACLRDLGWEQRHTERGNVWVRKHRG